MSIQELSTLETKKILSDSGLLCTTGAEISDVSESDLPPNTALELIKITEEQKKLLKKSWHHDENYKILVDVTSPQLAIAIAEITNDILEKIPYSNIRIPTILSLTLKQAIQNRGFCVAHLELERTGTDMQNYKYFLIVSNISRKNVCKTEILLKKINGIPYEQKSSDKQCDINRIYDNNCDIEIY